MKAGIGKISFYSGLIVVNEMEKLAYSEKKIEKNPWLLDDDKPVTSVKVSPHTSSRL